MGLKQFKDKYRGDTLVIFGDGPSIKNFRLANFAGYKSMCCGNLLFHNEFFELSPEFYVIPEPWLFRHRVFQPKILDHFAMIGKELKCQIHSNKLEFFLNLTNIGLFPESNVHYVHRILRSYFKGFEEFKGIDIFGGSFRAVLSIAYYMGFKKVFLVGHDAWTMNRASSQRWYEHGLHYNGLIKDLERNEFIEIIKKKMEIISVLPDPRWARNFKSISYEEFSGDILSYRENTDLCRRRFLDILDTSEMYNIYPSNHY